MEDVIKTGRIVAVEKQSLKVELVSCSACSGCAIRSSCGLSEIKKKIVSVSNIDSNQYHIGDEVNISINVKQGLKAVCWAFGIPLVLLLAVLFSVFVYSSNEIISGICGIIILIPYYFALFFNRHRMEDKFYCILKNRN